MLSVLLHIIKGKVFEAVEKESEIGFMEFKMVLGTADCKSGTGFKQFKTVDQYCGFFFLINCFYSKFFLGRVCGSLNTNLKLDLKF